MPGAGDGTGVRWGSVFIADDLMDGSGLRAVRLDGEAAQTLARTLLDQEFCPGDRGKARTPVWRKYENTGQSFMLALTPRPAGHAWPSRPKTMRCPSPFTLGAPLLHSLVRSTTLPSTKRSSLRHAGVLLRQSGPRLPQANARTAMVQELDALGFQHRLHGSDRMKAALEETRSLSLHVSDRADADSRGFSQGNLVDLRQHSRCLQLIAGREHCLSSVNSSLAIIATVALTMSTSASSYNTCCNEYGRQPMNDRLLSSSGAYNLSAIMSRAWVLARAQAAGQERARRICPELPSLTVRQVFRTALRTAWDEARSARSYAAWCAEQDAAREARKALDARTREIEELRMARAAADGIDSTRAFLATVRSINSRLAELGAR